MGPIHDLGHDLTCPLSSYIGFLCDRKFSRSFFAGWPKVLFPIFRSLAAIRINVVDLLEITVMPVIVVTG
jgi:hypothetical protein